MPGEREEISSHVLYIYGHMRRTLCSVDNDYGSLAVRVVCDCTHRVRDAQNI